MQPASFGRRCVNQRGGLALIVLVGILPLELNGLYNGSLSQMFGWYWLVEICTWILLPALLLWLGFKNEWFTWSDLGLHSKIAGRLHPWLFLGCLIPLAWVVMKTDLIFNFWAHVLFPNNYGQVNFGYVDVVPAYGVGRYLAIAHLGLTAGIVEEIYFRGIMRLIFPKGFWGGISFIVLSSVLFASIHWEGGIRSLAECFLFGFLSSVLYTALGNLWPLIMGHAWADMIWFS